MKQYELNYKFIIKMLAIFNITLSKRWELKFCDFNFIDGTICFVLLLRY